MKGRIGKVRAAAGALLIVLATVWALAGCAAGRSRAVVDDQTIVVGVKTALEAFPDNSYEEVQVASRRGTVALSGVVDNEWLRYNAVGIAMQVHGVRAVLNAIRIRDGDDGTAPGDDDEDDDVIALRGAPLSLLAI